jgi:hypothetical protein
VSRTTAFWKTERSIPAGKLTNSYMDLEAEGMKRAAESA